MMEVAPSTLTSDWSMFTVSKQMCVVHQIKLAQRIIHLFTSLPFFLLIFMTPRQNEYISTSSQNFSKQKMRMLTQQGIDFAQSEEGLVRTPMFENRGNIKIMG